MQTIYLILQSIFLGIVEGVTEFLPISSTGHLIIAEKMLGFNQYRSEFVELFTYGIQLGAIGAIVVLYWKKIKDTLVHFIPQHKKDTSSGLYFWLMIVLSCVPGVIAVFLLDDLADKYFFNAPSVAVTLFLGGIAMIVAENYLRKPDQQDAQLIITPKQALVIGAFQCLSIIPGMSRSASTIIGGWAAGLSTVAAAEFSFFLAIPVMVGMSLLKVLEIGGLSSLTLLEGVSLATGFVVAFFVALIVVKKFIQYLQTKPMRGFAVYRMIFAVLVLAAGFAGFF